MSKLDFTVVEIKEDMFVYGLGQKSNDRTQSKDIPILTKKYYDIVEKESGKVIPFFVVSKDYNKSTRNFKLFIGGLLENKGLDTLIIPRGLFIRATIKPKMGFLWGLSIGEAKRTFYTGWLPKSDYTALNMEYEHHTEVSISRNPQIDILFAVEKR